jgi:hypothetical protein
VVDVAQPDTLKTTGWKVAIGEYRSTSLVALPSMRTVAMPASGPR